MCECVYLRMYIWELHLQPISFNTSGWKMPFRSPSSDNCSTRRNGSKPKFRPRAASCSHANLAFPFNSCANKQTRNPKNANAWWNKKVKKQLNDKHLHLYIYKFPVGTVRRESSQLLSIFKLPIDIILHINNFSYFILAVLVIRNRPKILFRFRF